MGDFRVFHFGRLTMAVLTSIECRVVKYVSFRIMSFDTPTRITPSNNNNDEYSPIFHAIPPARPDFGLRRDTNRHRIEGCWSQKKYLSVSLEPIIVYFISLHIACPITLRKLAWKGRGFADFPKLEIGFVRCRLVFVLLSGFSFHCLGWKTLWKKLSTAFQPRPRI